MTDRPTWKATYTIHNPNGAVIETKTELFQADSKEDAETIANDSAVYGRPIDTCEVQKVTRATSNGCKGCGREVTLLSNGYCGFCQDQAGDDAEYWQTDKENDRILLEDIAISLRGEDGRKIPPDHSSALDGYVAFAEGNLHLTFEEVNE